MGIITLLKKSLFPSFFAVFIGYTVYAQDTDNDMVINVMDVDDDNDGILDEIENASALEQIAWVHTINGEKTRDASFSSNAKAFFSKTEPVYFGLGLYENRDENLDAYVFNGSEETTFADAKTFGDYIEVSFTPSENLLLNGVGLSLGSFDMKPKFISSNFKMAVAVSSSQNYEKEELLFPCISVDTKEVLEGTNLVMNVLEDKLLLKDVGYTFRCYFFDLEGANFSKSIVFDEIQFPVTVISLCDFDGDGIVNSHDLDSDGDGIYDVVESGGFDANNDGRADDDNDNRNNINSKGVPTSADKGTLPIMTSGILDFLNPDNIKETSTNSNSIAVVK